MTVVAGVLGILLVVVLIGIGMTMSVLMRVKLSWPGSHISILETLFPTGLPAASCRPSFICPW